MRLLLSSFLIFLFILASTSVLAQDKTGLKTSIAVDLVGEFNADKESNAADKFSPRSIDVMFYAPIDHLFDGVLSVAAHDEGGESVAELHEAFIGSSRVIPGLNFKLGQYFLGVGRLNRYHRHEWPFISAPMVHEKFFGEEGVIDSGLELSYLAPLPFYFDITVGATNGFVYGHSHNEGEKPKTPTYYTHLKFFESWGVWDVQPGISFLRRVSAEGLDMSLTGVDLTAKVKEGKTLKYLVQSEVWQRKTKTDEQSNEEIMTGMYVYPQYGFGDGVELGMRIDYFTVNTLKDASGKSVDNSDTAIVPTLTCRPSEFSSWRLSFKNQVYKVAEESPVENKIIELQATFMLGAHPSHAF
jgi:hypothetical protein